MATTQPFQYRGYEIVPRRQWSQWCVSVYPTRSDLPILSRSTLNTLSSQNAEALGGKKTPRPDPVDRGLEPLARRPQRCRP